MRMTRHVIDAIVLRSSFVSTWPTWPCAWKVMAATFPPDVEPKESPRPSWLPAEWRMGMKSHLTGGKYTVFAPPATAEPRFAYKWVDRKGRVEQLRKQMEAVAKADVSMAPKDAQAPPDEPLEPVTYFFTLKSHISWR